MAERTFTHINIRPEPNILDYTKLGPTNVADVFKEAANHIHALRSVTKHKNLGNKTIDNKLVHQLSMVVYGSNMIERVGTNRSETLKLSREIFRGGRPDATPQCSPSGILEAHTQLDAQSDLDIQQRRELISHALAFKHMIESIVHEHKPFSEQLIKDTHAILCSGLPIVTTDGEIINSSLYAGEYRSRHVSAWNTNFVTPSRIGEVMARFVSELNDRIVQAEREGGIDPFFVAAHACGEFVNIHPFLDGNGRTCRIILNVILLKYAGVVAPFGIDERELREYLDIARRRSSEEAGNGELAWYTLQQSMLVFRKLLEGRR